MRCPPVLASCIGISRFISALRLTITGFACPNAKRNTAPLPISYAASISISLTCPPKPYPHQQRSPPLAGFLHSCIRPGIALVSPRHAPMHRPGIALASALIAPTGASECQAPCPRPIVENRLQALYARSKGSRQLRDIRNAPKKGYAPGNTRTGATSTRHYPHPPRPARGTTRTGLTRTRVDLHLRDPERVHQDAPRPGRGRSGRGLTLKRCMLTPTTRNN
jgi:hypothetical protein